MDVPWSSCPQTEDLGKKTSSLIQDPEELWKPRRRWNRQEGDQNRTHIQKLTPSLGTASSALKKAIVQKLGQQMPTPSLHMLGEAQGSAMSCAAQIWGVQTYRKYNQH